MIISETSLLNNTLQ